jgi:hypothetical protein
MLGLVAGGREFAVGRGFAAGYLEGAQLPFLLQGEKVNVDVFDPEIANGLDPTSGHCPDVRAFFGDMAVFGGVVVADNQVGAVRRQVVLVLATELNCLCCDLRLDGRKQGLVHRHVPDE